MKSAGVSVFDIGVREPPFRLRWEAPLESGPAGISPATVTRPQDNGSRKRWCRQRKPSQISRGREDAPGRWLGLFFRLMGQGST